MQVQAAAFPMPKCLHPDRLRPLLMAARCVAGNLPTSSARKVRAAVRLWKASLDWFGIEESAIDESFVVALIILRCCPPVGMPLPDFASRPVLPTTAASDIDVLRRAAREQLYDMGTFLGPLSHDRVLRLQRSIGGRVSRLKTNKKPFLYSNLLECTEQSLSRSASVDDAKEAFALTLGFFFGMRAAELLSLKGADVNESGDGTMVLVTFRSVKTRQSLFVTHEPIVVAGCAPLLSQMFALFNEKVGFSPTYPLFHYWKSSRSERVQKDFKWSQRHVHGYTRDWLAHAVHRWAPGCTPHSLRVGCATEAWAAGVPLERIQALGRWKSSAALLYIIGSLDQTASATARLGHGGLAFTADGLRAQIGTSSAVKDSWWPIPDKHPAPSSDVSSVSSDDDE